MPIKAMNRVTRGPTRSAVLPKSGALEAAMTPISATSPTAPGLQPNVGLCKYKLAPSQNALNDPKVAA